MPQGEVGEVCIGGDGLADGYWRQPGLTAERFVTPPGSSSPVQRLYLTGDLGRIREDGILEFHGRRDGQVKVRGQRIELAEVESILRRHPLVEDAAVIADVHEGRARHLVAFVTWRPGPPLAEAGPSASQLLAWMRTQAAPHLVPARACVLNSLPRTPSGKIDRTSLVQAAQASMNATGGPAAHEPGSHEERAIQLWRHLLGRDDVHPDSDFFDLGGDSLMAVTMLDAFARASGCHVPIGAWLASPTPRNLASHARASHGLQSLRVFLVEWLLHWDATDLADIPCHVLPFPPCPSTPAEARVPHLAQGCLEALGQHDAGAPFVLVGYSMAGFVALEMARHLSEAGQPPLDVWLVDSVLPTGLHKASTRLAVRAGQLLGLPFARQLALARIGHSLAEVILPVTQARLREASVRLLHELRRARAFLRGNNRLRHPSPSPPPTQGHPSHHLHVWANHSYQPKPYHGTVACFLTQSSQRDQPGPKNGWATVLPNIDVIDIPGTHESCIRRHRPALLEAFRARLDARRPALASRT